MLKYIVIALFSAFAAFGAHAQTKQLAATPSANTATASAPQNTAAATAVSAQLKPFLGHWRGTRTFSCSAEPRGYDLTVSPGDSPNAVWVLYNTQYTSCLRGVIQDMKKEARLLDGQLFWCGPTKSFRAKLQGGQLRVDHWWDGDCRGLTSGWADGASLDKTE